MKYLSVCRFVKHYISSILGKLEGFLITPLVFPHRDWRRKDLNGVNAVIRLYWKKPI